MHFSPEALNVLGPLIVLGPLFAAVFAGLLQRYIGDRVAMIVTTASIGLSLVLSWPIFADFVWGEGTTQVVAEALTELLQAEAPERHARWGAATLLGDFGARLHNRRGSDGL